MREKKSIKLAIDILKKKNKYNNTNMRICYFKCSNTQTCEIRTLEKFYDNYNICASSIKCETIAINNFTLLYIVSAQTVS